MENNAATALKQILFVSLIPVMLLAGTVAAIYIYSEINASHFERGAIRISAPVTDATYQQKQRKTYHGSGRRGRRVTYGPKYTRTNIEYTYTVGAKRYVKSTFVDKKIHITVGDSVRIEYAKDKPQLSRTIENRYGDPIIRKRILKIKQATQKEVSQSLVPHTFRNKKTMIPTGIGIDKKQLL